MTALEVGLAAVVGVLASLVTTFFTHLLTRRGADADAALQRRRELATIYLRAIEFLWASADETNHPAASAAPIIAALRFYSIPEIVEKWTHAYAVATTLPGVQHAANWVVHSEAAITLMRDHLEMVAPLPGRDGVLSDLHDARRRGDAR